MEKEIMREVRAAERTKSDKKKEWKMKKHSREDKI
jgi:hypothetical protein